MLPGFVLFLREGLEASLIVSILLAALRQLGQPEKMRAVWLGVIAAVLGSLVGGIALYVTVREYAGTSLQTILETITYVLAVVLLTYMTFWMQSHSRTLRSEIATQAGAAGSGFALGMLAFTSVGREGLESAVFTLAFAFETKGALLLGGALGIMTSVALSVLIYRFGYRLDFRLFFRVMGILLLVFAAGLVGNAVQNMQALGWIHAGTTPLWNISRFLSEDSMLGDLLHSFVGYSASPSQLQGALYALYLVIVGGWFWMMTRKPPAREATVELSTTAAIPHQA